MRGCWLGAGTGELVHGEVVGWDPETQRHLVLYDDGEHEHLLLCEEHVTLHAPQRGLAAQIAPGLPEGELQPTLAAHAAQSGSSCHSGCHWQGGEWLLVLESPNCIRVSAPSADVSPVRSTFAVGQEFTCRHAPCMRFPCSQEVPLLTGRR